jgi:hypothetical protein
VQWLYEITWWQWVIIFLVFAVTSNGSALKRLADRIEGLESRLPQPHHQPDPRFLDAECNRWLDKWAAEQKQIRNSWFGKTCLKHALERREPWIVQAVERGQYQDIAAMLTAPPAESAPKV